MSSKGNVRTSRGDSTNAGPDFLRANVALLARIPCSLVMRAGHAFDMLPLDDPLH